MVMTIDFSGELGYPPPVAPAPVEARFLVRQVFMEVHLGPTWVGGQVQTIDQAVRPTFPNGHWYRAVNDAPGVTGGGEPAWPIDPGAQVGDGSVLWQESGPDPLDDVLWYRGRWSFDQPVASGEVNCVFAHGDYDNEVWVYAGTNPGVGLLLRAVGYRRDVSADLYPRAVSHQIVGRLQRAAEFKLALSDISLGAGGIGPWTGNGFGIIVPQILGRTVVGSVWSDWTAYASEIVSAVLTMSGVFFDPTDILSSKVFYGWPDFTSFMWSSGTPALLAFTPTQSTESALDYIHRYDEIDAEWEGNTNPDNFAQGGFYRTSEGIAGRVYRWRVGGRPTGRTDFTLTEGIDILEGSQIARKYPGGNRVLVEGHDWGVAGVGGWRYVAQRNNRYMAQDIARAVGSAPSSSMIMWRSYSLDAQSMMPAWAPNVAYVATMAIRPTTPNGHVYTAQLGSGTLIANSGDTEPDWPVDPNATVGDAGITWKEAGGDAVATVSALQYTSTQEGVPDGSVIGQDCQTVAEATLLEENKITPDGQIVTLEDAPFTQGQTVLVQGPGGAPARLLSGEPFWVRGVTLDVGHGSNGEPMFKQTLMVAGGGLDSSNLPTPDAIPLLPDIPPVDYLPPDA